MGIDRKYSFATLSGLLLALAYPGWGFDFGWLAWIGLVPLIWSLTQFAYKSGRLSVRTGFLIGFTAGLVYFLIIFRWFWSIHPLNTLGVENTILSLVIVGTVYIISSAGMALFWGLFGLAFSTVCSRLTTRYFLLTAPAMFVITEYLRSWGFGLLWSGSGSLFGPHWTMGNLAYGLAGNSLALYLASLVGIYGVTFLIVLINFIFFKILKRNQATRAMLVVVAMTLAGVTFIPKFLTLGPANDIPSEKINFAVIQTSQPAKVSPSSRETLAGFKEQLEMMAAVAKNYPESTLIVFPEASDFFKNMSIFLAPVEVENYFDKLFKEPRLIISGGRVYDSSAARAHSRVFLLDTQGGILNFYDKRLLMPGGEYLPYPINLITSMFSKNASSAFNNIRELSPGEKEISTVGFGYKLNVSPLICSELVSADITRQATQNTDLIISMASYSIFHGNHAIADQMLAATRFRAAENKKPVIAAVNMGRSYAIDSSGNIKFLAPNESPQILTGALAIHKQKSWYNKAGDLPTILVCLLLLAGPISLTWFKLLRRS
ncbi:MAG: apolipoprotein N-acyltransferase [Candidatus Yanofskybacteria bacterium RIFCSPHIGHO2_01_FULL_44_17]|uniref:Apolipoprotein N-acyltransferase n=1 Tax=Candidatus Yanofskybacteria bacterium RIFCSPHIGHO2_01_FULL_44_17 TaxID=1802668 RepID=A0A1F8EST6_9BACT|nr:MAG: apolipoprotein N-acyltransferase [Candidatus Yanofskybacteria bacterium RIFCSPHIGHO2_01_FULL_44_17]